MSAKTAWINAARAEVKHDDPLLHLQKHWGDWLIKPYYDADDIGIANPLPKLDFLHKSANGWYNLPIIEATQNDSNELAISHLNNGADGVVFQINQAVEPKTFLANIKPEFCFLGFEASTNSLSTLEKIESILQPIEKIEGAVFWDGDAPWQNVARLFKGHNNFRCFGISGGSLNEANLYAALQKAIHALDELTDNTFAAPHVLPKMAFSVESTSNFFLDVAMIRSLKVLFHRIGQAYQVENTTAFIRLVTPATATMNYEPHSAMISASLSALSGVSASVDAISIATENQHSNVHLHTARSVSLLLKEESKLDKVSDPLAGSYFIENLTSTITEKIWTKLKNS